MKPTFNNFTKQYSNLSALAKAVIRQANRTAAEAPEYLRNVRNASDGYCGFIYYSETSEFYAKNKAKILEALKEYADDSGITTLEVVKNFGCLKDVHEEDIALTLYGTKKQHDTYVANALAWFALEEVANRFQDFEYECEHN